MRRRGQPREETHTSVPSVEEKTQLMAGRREEKTQSTRRESCCEVAETPAPRFLVEGRSREEEEEEEEGAARRKSQPDQRGRSRSIKSEAQRLAGHDVTPL